ncbi:NAD(P)/FAD-dependent oxidoreductase [Haloechinothrix sp. LS1_15]|uniref:phytoene desaturase family protein n=1 Tax=Haloechinothrix sp. LS1_15 TaxID=2652248 RepID=UPI002946AEB0|nr:NAD(P)/FAD-dependent oxidoreductase [Haloechinothrix sp. LS1_15]MDV6011918.1 NAD(P)/FAD-dependent oxidoreductase [Haloechinothrix sp. LS1_15]
MTDAVVVGSGPNGLAGAVALARQGMRVTVLEAESEIGGGARSTELTEPGLLHDQCSAVHPFACGSPFLRALELERFGVEWLWPEIDLAHPLDSGGVGVLMRSIDETARGLGVDGRAWRRVFEGPSRAFDALAEDLLRPAMHVPRHPVTLARFGMRALPPATALARLWRTDEARALFAGIAAHAFYPLNRPLTSAIGVMLTAAGHRYGWPVARGGSQTIVDALVAVLKESGGVVVTGRRVSSYDDLPPAEVVLLDVSPTAAAEILGDRLPARVRRAYTRYRYGPGAYKVDLAVEGGVPWRNELCRRAGTIHVGGTIEEIDHAERQIHKGIMPERPFVLVAQQYLADPRRSAGDIHPVWTYAHVPHGYRGDATEAVLRQVERFAPGLRERIVGMFVRSTTEMPRYNTNYVGGDIATGANSPVQAVMRPRMAVDPYMTGVPGVYLCSAATPPGPGVHGMCGFNAAHAALRRYRRDV